MEAKNFELIDYLKVIWERRWLIISGTFLVVVITGITSFLMKPVYEIDTILQPGMSFFQSSDGDFKKFSVEPPIQIADIVRHGSYDVLLAADLETEESEIPNIEAINIRGTYLIRIWLEASDIDFGKKILDNLTMYLKEDMDAKIDVEINNFDTLIKTNEIEKEGSSKEIDILKTKLKIFAQREKNIQMEMESVKNKIQELEKEQLKILKKENRSETESLGMLLFSNEIQQSLYYYDILNEKLSKERKSEADIQSSIQKELSNIAKKDTIIANLKERKGNIEYTKVIKAPTPSTYPKSPKKKLNIILAFILGMMIFTMVAFFIDYLEKSKK